MFLNENMSDVSFMVGETKITSVRLPAHKFVLSFASSVFKCMFSGDFVEKNSSQVFVHDITPSAFKQTLR